MTKSIGIFSPAVDTAAKRAVGKTVTQLEPNVLRKIIENSLREEVVSLAGGMPPEDLFDLEGIKNAAATVLANEKHAASVLQYGKTVGDPELREQVASLMQGRGAEGVAPESVVITTGASQGIDLVARVLLEREDVLAVERPTFLATLNAAQLCEATVEGIEVDTDGLLVEGFEALLDRGPVKAIYTMPTFSNPSGALLSIERRRRLLELAREHGVVVIEDDAYGALWFAKPPPPSLLALAQEMSDPPACIHLSTFSKVMAPGLRLGWAIAPPSLLDRITVVKQIADVHTSTLDQAIASRYLASGRLPDHLERLRQGYAERSRWLTEAIREQIPEGRLRFAPPSGGMFLWCQLAEGSAREIADRALEHGVAVVPGDPFFSGLPGDPHLRLSYSQLNSSEANEAMRALAAALPSD